MTFELIWGMPIVWYLFLAGLGAGAFLTSVFLGGKRSDAQTMRKIGYIVAPIAVAIGLVLLMVDAEAGFHNPMRFFFLLTNFNSVMAWGVVFLGLFMVVSVAALALACAKKDVPRALDGIGALLAFCVAAYTGVLLGVCSPFPLWNNALLPVLFLVSAVSTGAAIVLVLSALACAKECAQAESLKKFHFFLPLIEAVLIASLLFVTNYNSVAGSESVASIVSGQWACWFWVGLVAAGLVLPSALEAWALASAKKEPTQDGAARWMSVAAGVGVLVGGFALRLVVVSAALPLATVAAVL